MSNLDFVRKLYNGKNCYSDHMNEDELNLVYISSEVENIILRYLESNKIVLLTGNPGDGKTFLIKKCIDEINALNVFVETDINRVANYEEVAKKLIDCYSQSRPAIVAINEYQFFQLCKIIRSLSHFIYEEIMAIKNNCIIYDAPNVEMKKIVIVDLNERSLLDRDRGLTRKIIETVRNLLVSEEIDNEQLKNNLKAISNEQVCNQIVNIIELATVNNSHFAVRDILGAISFMITACTTENYKDKPYYDAIFEGTNNLLQSIQQFDPVYLTNSSLDERLWNGDIRDGWMLDSPNIAPAATHFNDDAEGAINCFKSIKRKYYFEHNDGKSLALLQPNEIRLCTELFVKFEQNKKSIKEKIIRSINKLFLPTSDDKKQLRIWTTHRYDFSTDITSAISSRYIDSSQLEIKMPNLNDWLTGMEYVPDHIILRHKNNKNVQMVLDVEFLRTLDAIDNGYPVALLPSQYEQTASRFLRLLEDNNLADDNDGGEFIVASRKKSYKKSVFINDNKYSFEEDE